jgi:hypothetical protein
MRQQRTEAAAIEAEIAHLRSLDRARRDPTAWLGMKDSNSEMSPQIISLKGRTDLRECSRIPATETIRV